MKNTEEAEEDADSKEAAQEAEAATPHQVEEEKAATPAPKKKGSRSIVKVFFSIIVIQNMDFLVFFWLNFKHCSKLLNFNM
jgi:hypothetical protein